MEKKEIEQRAKDYAENNQYSLEDHDEGGYLGIDTKELARLLIDFHFHELAVEPLQEELIKMQHKEDAILSSMETTEKEKKKAENRFKSLTHVLQMLNAPINPPKP